jgi:hypothetical protein
MGVTKLKIIVAFLQSEATSPARIHTHHRGSVTATSHGHDARLLGLKRTAYPCLNDRVVFFLPKLECVR